MEIIKSISSNFTEAKVYFKNKFSKAFTLVEVIIALSLAGILFLSVFGIYFAIQRSMSDQNKDSSQSLKVMRFLDQLSNDLNNMIEQKWDTKIVFSAKKNIISGVRIDSIDFTRTSTYSGLGQSSVYDVSYFGYQDYESDQLLIIRRENSFFNYKNRKNGIFYPVADGIREFRLEFSLNGTDWEDEWDYTIKKRLPKLVKVTVKWEEGSSEKEFSMTVKPPLLWY